MRQKFFTFLKYVGIARTLFSKEMGYTGPACE